MNRATAVACCLAFLLQLNHLGAHSLPDTLADKVMEPSAAHQFSPPYPFTAADMWTRLHKVLQIPPEELSKERVEEVFDMQFKNYDSPGEMTAKLYGVNAIAGKDWYFTLRLHVGSQRTFFRFTWWDMMNPPSPYVVPLCVEVQPALEGIGKLGWKNLPRQGPFLHGRPIPSYIFRREDDELRISFLQGTSCMTDLTFSVGRSPTAVRPLSN